MTSITQEDVLLILKLLDESAFDELHLETGELKLVARKQGKGIRLDESAFEEKTRNSVQPTEPAAAIARDPHSSAMNLDASTEEARPPGRILEPPAIPPGLMPVRAPILGTFYRTPKPGAPPYVDVGSLVNEEDPVCILEVMKLFNTVKAGVRGRIAQVCAEQGQMVEFGQILFLVEKISEEKDLPEASHA
jgi:acetyl-CoA carboxylase biotin carboxyl carrier protein